MRSLAAALVGLFVFSLPLLAQAGDGCPYAEQATTTASVDDTTIPAHAGACGAACPHGATDCACAGETSAELQPADGEAAESLEETMDPGRAVATTD